MISDLLKNDFKKWGLFLTVFYIVSFGFLSVHKFQLWNLSPFIESLIGVFMGAGAIAIITGIILVFQQALESEQKKDNEVFKEKLSLYKDIITQMQEAFKVNEGEEKPMISTEEKQDLFFTQLNIALLSKPKTFRLYSEMLKNISDNEGNVTNDAPDKLLAFIKEARLDLDVQGDPTLKDETDLQAELACYAGQCEVV